MLSIKRSDDYLFVTKNIHTRLPFHNLQVSQFQQSTTTHSFFKLMISKSYTFHNSTIYLFKCQQHITFQNCNIQNFKNQQFKVHNVSIRTIKKTTFQKLEFQNLKQNLCIHVLFQIARAGFHFEVPEQSKVATKTISYERYGEILFQKVALCYLLHFVQDGSSKTH